MATTSPDRPPELTQELEVPRRGSGLVYTLLVAGGRIVYRITSTSVSMGREHTETPGGYLLVSNHTAPYDVSCLMQSSRRPIDFLSILRFGRRPFVGWLFRQMNSMFLERKGNDAATLKEAAKRLRRGHVVGIFPEGGMRNEKTRAILTGDYDPGFAQLAVLGRAPIVPVVILGSTRFGRSGAWFPWANTEWGIHFGEPIEVPKGMRMREAAAHMEAEWLKASRTLDEELREAMTQRFGEQSFE